MKVLILNTLSDEGRNLPGQRPNIDWDDLEAHPVTFTTDSEVGSKDILILNIYKERNFLVIGYIWIHFTDPLTYHLWHCQTTRETAMKQFPVDVPADSSKSWTISRTFNNLTISRNDTVVLDITFDDSCSKLNRSQHIAKIDSRLVPNEDGRIPSCDSLPDVAHLQIVSDRLPVYHGTKVSVQCEEGYTLQGDEELTCEGGDFTGTSACQSLGK